MILLLTLAWMAAAWLWFTDMPTNDEPLVLFQSVMAGLTGGIVLGAWTT